ncbi:MAG: alpha/beta hydrolase [Ktedonobacterales bacterium]|nr:alpha/beta hydrolase [Ktedonobacterales bacterium]
MAHLRAVEIPASHGHLEGLLRLPDQPAAPPRMAAVVCHPHPRFGGTLHNKVAFRIAQALVDRGIPALRFNFRGVGRSTGEYAEGQGERDDVRAALDALARRFPGIPLAVGGVSFGAWVGLPVGCADARVGLLLGVGVPVSLLRVADLDGCAIPKLIVQGERDEYGPLPELRTWFARLPEPKHLSVVADADHLFTRHQVQLYETLVASLAAVLG